MAARCCGRLRSTTTRSTPTGPRRLAGGVVAYVTWQDELVGLDVATGTERWRVTAQRDPLGMSRLVYAWSPEATTVTPSRWATSASASMYPTPSITRRWRSVRQGRSRRHDRRRPRLVPRRSGTDVARRDRLCVMHSPGGLRRSPLAGNGWSQGISRLSEATPVQVVRVVVRLPHGRDRRAVAGWAGHTTLCRHTSSRSRTGL